MSGKRADVDDVPKGGITAPTVQCGTAKGLMSALVRLMRFRPPNRSKRLEKLTRRLEAELRGSPPLVPDDIAEKDPAR
jgi:hypothetical protein